MLLRCLPLLLALLAAAAGAACRRCWRCGRCCCRCCWRCCRRCCCRCCCAVAAAVAGKGLRAGRTEGGVVGVRERAVKVKVRLPLGERHVGWRVVAQRVVAAHAAEAHDGHAQRADEQHGGLRDVGDDDGGRPPMAVYLQRTQRYTVSGYWALLSMQGGLGTVRAVAVYAAVRRTRPAAERVRSHPKTESWASAHRSRDHQSGHTAMVLGLGGGRALVQM
jgi:hypothetical protein